jgi:UDP-N-acetylglucosamine enolpyruvyl transferase
LLHWTFPLPVKPGSQMQTIVLSGRVSWTRHSALATQGLISRQGFLQVPLKHACLLGHSPSDLHPSSMTGSGTELSFTALVLQATTL